MRIIIRSLIGGVAAVMVAAPALAAGEGAPLDLATVVRLALEHQPKVVRAGSVAGAAEAAVSRAGARLRPQVQLRGADIFTGSRNGELDFISRDAPREVVGQVVVEQMLYDREAAARVRAAEAGAAAARAAGGDVRLEVATAASDAYFEVLARQAEIEVWRASRDQARRVVEATAEAVAGGTRNRLDLLRARLVVEKAEQGLAVARADASSASERLRILVGLDELPPLAEQSPPGPEVVVPGMDELTERAARFQPRIERLRHEVDRESALLAAARGRRWPQAYAEGAAGWDTGALPWRVDPGWSAAIYIVLPVYDGGAVGAAEEGARYRLEAARAEYRQALLDVRGELAKARGEGEAALARYRAADAAVTTREEIARISREGYRVGRLGSLDLAAAEEDAVRGRLDRVSAAAEVYRALARLDILTGRLPQGGGTP